ncbi:MAG: L-2-hydroxyglutarate oxidase [Propionibacteriaceae bacterium]
MSGVTCAVVGGGIIGAAVARELTRRYGSTVTLFEKEASLAQHQTGHNSGVVHAGLYYQPGSFKATLGRRGGDQLLDYAAEKGVPYDRCGKIVVARTPEEVSRLDAIHERARANGVPGVRIITADEVGEVEPHAVGLAALHSPHTAIVDYVALTHALAADVVDAGGAVRTGTRVSRLDSDGTSATVTVGRGRQAQRERFDLVISCAGLQSDRVAPSPGRVPRIVPFSGDYRQLVPQRSALVRGLIYPVPDPRYPFLGVHLTRMIDGTVTVGPNAFLSPGREQYRRLGLSPRDLIDVATFPGFWRFAGRNLAVAASELRQALGSSGFVAEARTFVPELEPGDLTWSSRGVRAQAMTRTGDLVDDFAVDCRGRVVALRNAPSPGATASMAIAEYLVDVAAESAGLKR